MSIVVAFITAVLLNFLQAFVCHKINVWYFPEHVFNFMKWFGITLIADVLIIKVSDEETKIASTEKKIDKFIIYLCAYLFILLTAWICKTL
jgi:hypothetical protein